jgi:hypothetical protein
VAPAPDGAAVDARGVRAHAPARLIPPTRARRRVGPAALDGEERLGGDSKTLDVSSRDTLRAVAAAPLSESRGGAGFPY